MTAEGLLAVVAVAIVYVVSLVLYPYTSCGWCSGGGKRREAGDTGNYGRCWRCKGSGEKRRFGVWLWTWLRRD